MRRKDFLIIISVLIIVEFITVIGMNLILNYDTVNEKVEQVVGTIKRTHHKNEWETAIVDKI